jgi:hypothetical protein
MSLRNIVVRADPATDAPPDVDIPVGQMPAGLASAVPSAPIMPRMATGRDYLDNPDTQAALENLYTKASPTFMPPSMGSATQENEHLISIDKAGKQNSYSVAPEGSSRHLNTQIPDDSSAIIHTHPYKANPTPSDTDYKTATAVGKPNFVMSRNAIYVAMPNGNVKQPVKVADVSPAKGGKLNIKWN